MEFQALEENHKGMITAYRSRKLGQESALVTTCRDFAQHTPGDAHGIGGPGVLHDLYEERIAAYRADPTENDWDGVFVATSK